MEASSGIEIIRNDVLFMPVDIIVEYRSKEKNEQGCRGREGHGKMIRKSKNT